MKHLLTTIAARLLAYTGDPVIANVNILSFEGQSVAGSEIEMINCYQTSIDTMKGGYLDVGRHGAYARR